MIGQYFHHIFQDGVLLFCSASMLVLFCIDFFGLLANRYGFIHTRTISFATTVVSIGLFATFVGVLHGLYGFNPTNVAESVPKLLEGLRFAFAGSVLGMGLSLVLSIAHKIIGGSAEDEQVLHSIDRKLGSLVETVQAPGELVRQFNEMRSFLKDHLERINVSLEMALDQLAKGATQEVIQALERIIRDFNENLTQQFGDNFKELNVACGKLVEWQRQYREHIEWTEKGLEHITRSLDQSCTAARELTLTNENTQRTCLEVSRLIKAFDIETLALEQHLKSCKTLGDEAKSFLVNTQSALSRSVESMNKFSVLIEDSVGKQSATLAQLTSEIEAHLPKALGELENVLTAITNQFAADYRSLFQFVTKN